MLAAFENHEKKEIPQSRIVVVVVERAETHRKNSFLLGRFDWSECLIDGQAMRTLSLTSLTT
jgi:hypothetical protein